jgi:hypothetical protein
MLMINKIRKYPSIIARPYIRALKKDAQWKDNQRYAFENLVTVLASYSVSDLLNIYVNLREPPEEENEAISEADLDTIESLKNIENLKAIGLEQMSLGKWCAILRETTKVLKECPDKCSIPELHKLFQPPSNDLWNDINKLVKQRNDDAHGVPISDSELNKVLNSRQEILDRILEQCSFLENYSISFFDKLVLKSDSQQISGKSFINDGQESLIVPADLETPLGEVLLINHNNNFSYIRLRPLIVFAPIGDQDNRQLSLYSKQLDKEGSKMHYLGVDGAVDIDIESFDKKYKQSLGQKWKYLHEIYSEEDVLVPNLNGKIIVSNSIEVDESNSLKVILDNTNSIDISDLKCMITFPKSFEISIDENDSFELKDIDSNTYEISLDSLDSNVVKDYEIKFKANEQGSVRVSSPYIEFKYFRTEADSNIEKFTEFETRIDGSSIEVIDPKSPDKMIPIINVNRHYLAIDSSPINNIEIGENFIYELLITNIGIGAARDLSIEVVFPEHLELVEGVDELLINLNPSETRSHRYLASTNVPGQYKIHLRDLSYKDFEGNKYISSFSDDFSIVVKSNIEKQFQFELSESIKDFTIDNLEKQQLDLRKEQLREIYKNSDEINIDELFIRSLFDAAINNIRNIVSKVAKKRDFEVTEKIISETKNQAKLNDDNARKSLIFSISEVPFFGVDITNPEEILFHSIDAKMIENIHDFTYKTLFATNSISGYILPLSMKYEPMLWSKELDSNFFKKWVNLSISTVIKEHLPVFEIKSQVEDALNIKLAYKAGSFQKWFSKDGALKKLIKLDEDGKPVLFAGDGHLKLSIDDIIFRETGIVRIELINSRGEYFLGMEGLGKEALTDDKWDKNNIIYLSPQSIGQKNSDLSKRWTDNERLSWWWIKNNKSSNFTFIKVKNGDISPFLELIKLHQIATSKLYLHNTFKDQDGIDIVKDNIDKLSDKGFLLRPCTVSNIWGYGGHPKNLEVYPYTHKLGAATKYNCIGFLHKDKKTWNFFVNFYNFSGYSEYDSEIKNNYTIFTKSAAGITTIIEQSNRVFKSNNVNRDNCSEQLDLFFKLIFKSITFWDKNAYSIWPSCFIHEMIIHFINQGLDVNRADRANLLQRLIDDDIIESSIEKQYKSIVRNCDKLYHQCNAITPLKTINGVVSIENQYKDCINELAQEEGSLSALIQPKNKANDKKSEESE